MIKGPEGRFAWTTKMGAKGQIVIPSEARRLFNFKPGDTILLLGEENRGMIIVPQDKFAEVFNEISKNIKSN